MHVCIHYTNMMVFSHRGTQPTTLNGSVLRGGGKRIFCFYFIFFIRRFRVTRFSLGIAQDTVVTLPQQRHGIVVP